MNNKKELLVNISAQIIGFSVNLGLSFFLTPYIVNNVGGEAYGFIGLANNFVSYAQVITVALNSMASRFITIKIYKNDNDGASRYFTSVVVANIFLAFAMLIPSAFVIIFLERIVIVSKYILWDVKLLWAFIFVNFIISIISSTFSVATFATNKLYLSSVNAIISQMLKVFVLILFYKMFTPSVWYVGLATIVSTIYIMLWDIRYTKKLLPDIKFKKKYFDLNSIKEILSSGIWSSINQITVILSSGLDLLVTNIFVGSIEMGIMAISKTIPNAMSLLLGSVSNVFSPSMTQLYAEKKNKELILTLKRSMKIMSIFAVIPNGILISFGMAFYNLWVPNENANLLYILSVLACINSVITGTIYPMYSVVTIINKVKISSIANIFRSILSTIITIIIIYFTDFDLYAIAGTSSLFSILYSLIFYIPFISNSLEVSWYTFYREVIESILATIILSIIGLQINNVFISDSWVMLMIVCVCYTFVSFVVLYFVIFNRIERKAILENFRNIIIRR